MGPFAQPAIFWSMANVHTVAGGQRGEGRVGTRERSRHDANGEKQHQQRRRLLDIGGQQHVALHASTQHHGQQDAKGEEQQVGRHEGHTIAAHVLLSIAQGATGQVLLHHILIQTRHHDDDKRAADELLPEVVGRLPVVEDKDTAHAVGSDGVDSLAHRHIKTIDDR